MASRASGELSPASEVDAQLGTIHEGQANTNTDESGDAMQQDLKKESAALRQMISQKENKDGENAAHGFSSTKPHTPGMPAIRREDMLHIGHGCPSMLQRWATEPFHQGPWILKADVQAASSSVRGNSVTQYQPESQPTNSQLISHRDSTPTWSWPKTLTL